MLSVFTEAAKTVSIHKDINKNGRVAFFIQASGSPTRIGITKKKGTQTKRPFMGRCTWLLSLYSYLIDRCSSIKPIVYRRWWVIKIPPLDVRSGKKMWIYVV